jgi:hypothetical protein
MSKRLPKAQKVVPAPLGLTAWQIYVLDQIVQLRSAQEKWPFSRSEVARFIIDSEAERLRIVKDAKYKKWLRVNGLSE